MEHILKMLVEWLLHCRSLWATNQMLASVHKGRLDVLTWVSFQSNKVLFQKAEFSFPNINFNKLTAKVPQINIYVCSVQNNYKIIILQFQQT